jgi:poly(hydroxyalkanoate) depolymerase family esterase
MVASSTVRQHRLVRVFALGVVVAALVLQFGVSRPVWAAAGTFIQYTYSGPAGSRPYFVYTPAGYNPATRVPLIVMLHGCLQNPIDFANGTAMDNLADAKQFIVVYPQQTNAADPIECWHWYLPAHQSRGAGEPAIIAGITQTVVATTTSWNIDSTRIYLGGFSAGAAMAVIMGATYPDIYAAIGEESGLEYAAAWDANSRDAAELGGGPDPYGQGKLAYSAMGPYARVVPVITFHGSSDTIVVPTNGDQVVKQWGVTDILASKNTYHPQFTSPYSTTVGQAPGLQGHPYTVRTWLDDFGHEVQQYWSVVGMGHAWSGGSTAGTDTDPNGPSATQAMYTFFLAHSK